MRRFKNFYHRTIAVAATVAIGFVIVKLVIDFWNKGEWWTAAMALGASSVVWMYATCLVMEDK
jgi:hypothetical protein